MQFFVLLAPLRAWLWCGSNIITLSQIELSTDAVWNFHLWVSLLAVSLWDGFYVIRKDGTGGGWVHPGCGHCCYLDTRWYDSDAYTVHAYLLFKFFVNTHTQTPLLWWTSFPTRLVSQTRLPTTPFPSPALPLSLREWSPQRHSLGEGGLGHQLVAWMSSLSIAPSTSPPPTWTSPPAPVYWQWERPLLETTATAAELTSLS